MGKSKRKTEKVENDEANEPEETEVAPKKNKVLRNPKTKRLIVLLDNASLQTVKTAKGYELLDCDKHKHMMGRLKIDPATCRPDIAHQCLLMLLDSPLNKAGMLQVYVRTDKNILIEVHPQTRIPRTFPRFAGLMVELLHKFVVRASDGPVKLLKIIKNPINDYLPVGCPKIATSFHSDAVVDFKSLVPTESEPFVVVIGAMAHGSVDPDFTEQTVSISDYPLSGALTCAKICSATEEIWGIR